MSVIATQSVSVAEIIHAWISRAGDPQISSMINTVLYTVSALAAAYRWRVLRHLKAPFAEQSFWLILLFVLLVLGFNKQLDLQILLVEIGRPVALQGGWYNSRRMVQAVFALFLTGVAGLIAAIVVFLVRKHWRDNALALLGLLILCIYGIIEALSQSHIELSLIFQEKWGVRTSDLIEMAGIVLILANAVYYGKKE